MWAEIITHLPEYPSAVVSARDDDGYPLSFRCQPNPDVAALALRVRVPPSVPVRPGPASLLCHKHDEQLWHQRSFLVRGALERDADGWLLRPDQYIPGLGYGGVLGQVRFLLGARRAARRYLAACHLPRPTVPWEQLEELRRQAFVNLAAERALRAPVREAPPPRRIDPPAGVTTPALAGGRLVAPLPRARLLPALALAALALVGVALGGVALWRRRHRE